MSHCLVRILGWRIDWAVLFRKWGQKCSNSEWRTLSQHDNGGFLASVGRYGYGRRGTSRTAQPVTLRSNQLSCWEKNFLAVPSHAANRIGHRGLAIWHRATCFFGGLWSLVSMPTNHKEFLSSRRRFDVSNEPQLCGNVIESFVKRAIVCQQSRGGHFSDIVFHN
jgi:hypothetical protein